MSETVAESYHLCCRIARRTARNFYYSFVVMPPEKRQAMCAIYAFMRRSDDIADGATHPAQATEDLRRWRAEVVAALSNTVVSPDAQDPGTTIDPILPALADTVRRYRIPTQAFP